MPEDADKPLSIAIAHLFTTGRDPLRDAILHIACRRYEQGASPQEKDWIVNPERKITRRVYRHTGISKKESAGKPLWEEVRKNVLSFLDEVEVLFIFDSNSERWFRNVVYEGIALPSIVDLLEAHKFFLPENSSPYSDSAIINMDASAPRSRSIRKLHKVLNGMYGMLDGILGVILSREKIHGEVSSTEYHYPVYNLLDWSLAVEGAPSAFKAMQRVASKAAKIQWEAGQIEGAFYDTPTKLDKEELLLFIENWKPLNPIKEDRKPYNEGFMAGEIPERYSEDNSTRCLLQVLEFILAYAGVISQTPKRVKDDLHAIKSQCQVMRRHIFGTLHVVYRIAETKDPLDRSSHYTRKHDELYSAYHELTACLEKIEAIFLSLHVNELSQLPQDIFNNEHLHLVSEWVQMASERAGKLRRSLSKTRDKCPKPDSLLPDQVVRRTMQRLFTDLGKLNHEYFASTIPIQDEYLDLGFQLLYSNKRFGERPEQRWYAQFISGAINFDGQYVAEAGTGTGKTLGYLIPACEHSRVNKNRQVVVATATINLMDQIITKEWRTLTSPQDSLYRDLQIATLKGKRNYLCVTVLKKLFTDLNLGEDNETKRADFLFVAEDRLAWLYLFQILTRKNGQWDSATEFRRKYPEIAKKYPVDAETACKPKQCKMGKDCIYPQAVRRAQYADVVITNHHKLANLDDEIKKRVSVCIIDEADQFPDNLRSVLSESITREEVRDFIGRVVGSETRRGFVQILRDKLQEKVERDKLEKQLSEDLFQSLGSIEKSCKNMSDRLWEITFTGEDEYPKRWKDLKQGTQDKAKTMLSDLEKHLSVVENEFEEILKSDWYSQTQNLSRNRSSEKDRLIQYHSEAGGLLNSVKTILAAISDKQFIITYEQSRFNWTLTKMPFNIGDQARDLMNSFETSIFTSATLYVDEVKDLFILELFDDLVSAPPFTAETRISSPFRYDEQVGGAVTPFIPSYIYNEPNKNLERKIVDTIALLAVALDGRTMVLFTNWKEMQKMHKRIQPILEKYDIPVLLQDKAGSSEAIIEEFGGLEESVLLGTGRFWTGVNFPGPTLSQLIIVRIPNDPLGRPLVKERKDRWTKEKFWDFWYSQNTWRTLSQGFGRLIRKSDDKGLFLILDSRILSHPHMTAHKTAIPIELNDKFDSPVELANWGVKRLGLSPELKERGISLAQVYQKIKHELPLS